jgi:segregation and condensation protein B
MTYGTTVAFLEYFGLRSLEELPAADELRRVPVQKPESLVTAEPGLATVPPEQLALQTGETTQTAESAAATEPAAPAPPPAAQLEVKPPAEAPNPDTQS